MYERLDKTKAEVDGKNLTLVFGIIGTLLGASCVLFALARDPIKAIVIAVVGAAALGIVGANLSNWMFFNLRESSSKEIQLMGIALDGMKTNHYLPTRCYGDCWDWGWDWGLEPPGASASQSSLEISGLLGGVLGAMMYVILTAQFSVATLMKPRNSL